MFGTTTVENEFGGIMCSIYLLKNAITGITVGAALGGYKSNSSSSTRFALLSMIK